MVADELRREADVFTGLADSDQRSAAIRPTGQRRYHALGGSIARKAAKYRNSPCMHCEIRRTEYVRRLPPSMVIAGVAGFGRQGNVRLQEFDQRGDP